MASCAFVQLAVKHQIAKINTSYFESSVFWHAKNAKSLYPAPLMCTFLTVCAIKYVCNSEGKQYSAGSLFRFFKVLLSTHDFLKIVSSRLPNRFISFGVTRRVHAKTKTHEELRHARFAWQQLN